MERTSSDPPDRWLDLLDPLRIARLLLHRYVRLVAAWVVAILVAWFTFKTGWNCMNEPARADGNSAHVNIDFSGQYLLGRMIVDGQGRRLYHREEQKEVLKKSYPQEGENPNQQRRDWEDIEDWMIGASDGDLRGPLYPPVHALLYAPLTYLPPLTAYRVMQVITMLLTFIVAFLAEQITRERVWCPVALVVVVCVPGYMGALGLGQNPLLTLTLLMTGWWLVTTKRPVLGGIVWGFLAYKPVWAVAFLPVLLVTGRWKASAAMVVTGMALGLATLPFVGYQCWLDWLQMGQIAADRYTWDENWLILSRDLINLPRRPFIAHDKQHLPIYVYGKLLPDVLSYRLWLDVMAVSLVVALLRRRQVSLPAGPGAAFLFLAGWMSCLHFMYYDVMLTFLPLCLLFCEPWRFLRVRLFPRPRKPLPPELTAYYQPALFTEPPPVPLLPGGLALRWVRNPLPPLLLLLLLAVPPLLIWHDSTYHFPPVDTFCVLALWAWCGWAVWTKDVWGEELLKLPGEGADENASQMPAESGVSTAEPAVTGVFRPEQEERITE
jgi:arabinofuranan 3-O-arabinosyltransferase